MAIKIKDAEEFTRLLEALANELVDANIYLKLHEDLTAAGREYSTELHQSWTFWSLTLQSLFDAAIFRLCKTYDQSDGVVSLPNLVETIQENVAIFSQEEFRERLKDNPFVESLAQDARAPDPEQLKHDLELVSLKTHEKVKLLSLLRHNFYAHRGATHVLRADDLGTKYPLTLDDARELLRNGMAIVNRYSSLFRAQTYSTQIVGHDDYRYVLGTVREDLRRREEAMHDEERRFGSRNIPGQ